MNANTSKVTEGANRNADNELNARGHPVYRLPTPWKSNVGRNDSQDRGRQVSRN